MNAASVSLNLPLEALQTKFLTLLPRIRAHACYHFRFLACPHRREEAVADVIALCWSWYRRLAQRGKDAAAFISALTAFAARQVRCGRYLGGTDRSRDALNPVAQRRHGFRVTRLPDIATLMGNALAEALQDNSRSSPPDAAAFRVDWPQWLATRTHRERRLIHDMVMGERTKDLARRYRLSRGRISQKRREFHADWTRFHGEEFPRGTTVR
jgi:hypothetical protein